MLLSSKVAARLAQTLRDKIFKKVLSFSTSEFKQFSTASLITRSTNDVQQIQMLMTMLFRVVVYAPIIGIGGFFMVLANSNMSMAWIIGIAVFAVAIIGVWSIIGYNMVLFLSGLQEIPRDYYEAASIDGATGVNAFFNITVPLLSPTIFFVLVTRVIGSLQVFDLIYMVIDKSNPALTKTQSLVYLFYKYAFINKNMGYGATIVVVLLIITMILTVFQMIGQKKWVFYN